MLDRRELSLLGASMAHTWQLNLVQRKGLAGDRLPVVRKIAGHLLIKRWLKIGLVRTVCAVRWKRQKGSMGGYACVCRRENVCVVRREKDFEEGCRRESVYLYVRVKGRVKEE
jgi:hypothetical protein